MEAAVRNAAPLTPPAQESIQSAMPTASIARQMSTAVSRQTALNALLANSRTKSALLQSAAKLGYGEADVRGALSNPLRAGTNRTLPTNPDDEAFNALNWHSGFTFTSSSSPTYGPRGYRLGYLRVFPCSNSPSTSDYDFLWLPRVQYPVSALTLYVELPREPALYTFTIRMSRGNGTCHPGWLTTRSGSAPVACYYRECRRSAWTSEVPVVLTALSDGCGYVGIVNANPDSSATPGLYGMRRTTAEMRLVLDPRRVGAGEAMTQIVFRNCTLMRL